MYRGRTWTMRQIAGFGTAEDTNRRFKYLIAQGQTGLSTDFDMPTLMGYDSDHPMSEGEVGREGVAIDTLADMEQLFDGIDLEKISVSMTINPSAWILLAMYVALAQKRGYDLNKLSGTIQADILKEYMAQKEWIYPIAPSVRIVRDCITYCAQQHEALQPDQHLGLSHLGGGQLAARRGGVHDVQPRSPTSRRWSKTGMHVDEFAPRLAFFFVCQADFFEEIAKFRAAAARLRQDHEGALRRAEPGVDAAALPLPDRRGVAHQAAVPDQHRAHGAAGARRGARRRAEPAHQRHGRGVRDPDRGGDEDRAAHAADHRRRDRGVANVVDPLGGSYFVESLTTQYERAIFAIIDEVDAQRRHDQADRGGLVPAPHRRLRLRDAR